MSKKSKLLLEKERLKLRVEQQKYVVYRDYVKLKDTYNPMRVATDTILNSISDGRWNNTDTLSPLEQQNLKTERKERIANARDLILQVFMFVESFLVPPSERKRYTNNRPSLQEQQQGKLTGTEVQDDDTDAEQYIIGKDDQ